MYSQMLIPLDGSQAAEAVLPYARVLARKLGLAVELSGVVDDRALAIELSHGRGRLFENMVTEIARNNEAYLTRMAATFPGSNVICTTERGKPEEVILEKADKKPTLITMATHGRSGLNRFLMGSVAEKVLRGATVPILLIRANEGANNEGEATLNSVIAPLDGSQLAESVISHVSTLAGKLGLEVILLRAYNIPADILRR
jgi:nucleotide-binding universal stress UspA family protein